MQRVINFAFFADIAAADLPAIDAYLTDHFQHGDVLAKDIERTLVNPAKERDAFTVTFSHELVAVSCEAEKKYYVVSEIVHRTDWSVTFYANATLTKKNQCWHWQTLNTEKFMVTKTLNLEQLQDEQNLLLHRLISQDSTALYWQGGRVHKTTLTFSEPLADPVTIFFLLNAALQKRASGLNPNDYLYQLVQNEEKAHGKFSKVYLSPKVLKPTLFGRFNTKKSNRVIKQSSATENKPRDVVLQSVKHLRSKKPVQITVEGKPLRIMVEKNQPGQEGYEVYVDKNRHTPFSLFKLAIAIYEACYEQTVLYGLVHRDINWANLCIDKQGERWIVNLIDYDSAKFINDPDGHNLGTIYYMAKEAYLGQSRTESDIYSLGILLYTLFDGFFEGDGFMFACNPCIKGAFSDPTWPPLLSERLPSLLGRMILPSWEQRPSYHDIGIELDKLLLEMHCLQTSLPQDEVRALADNAIALRHKIRYVGLEKKDEVLKALSQTFPTEEKACVIYKDFLRINAAWDKKDLATLKQDYALWINELEAVPLETLSREVKIMLDKLNIRQSEATLYYEQLARDMLVCLETVQNDPRNKPTKFDEIEKSYFQIKHWKEKANQLVDEVTRALQRPGFFA